MTRITRLSPTQIQMEKWKNRFFLKRAYVLTALSPRRFRPVVDPKQKSQIIKENQEIKAFSEKVNRTVVHESGK